VELHHGSRPAARRAKRWHGKAGQVIREIVDTEAELQRLDDLYREGRTLYDRPGLDPNQWIADMATWSARVDEEIKRQYSVSLRFKYKTWVLEGFTITIKASGLQQRAWAIPKTFHGAIGRA
jgi:hypothetical protein